MKHLKMFGLAAIVALGLTAWVGSATAQAELFTDNAKTIRYATGTVIDLSLKSGTSTKVTSGGSTIATCTGSTAKGKTSNETGNTISVSIESLTWSGCNQTTDTVANGTLEIKWTSGTSGEVIGKDSQWTMSIFASTCTYGFGGGTKLGTITGGSEPVLTIETTIIKTAGSFLCPSTAGSDAEYTFTEPHALFVGGVAPTTSFYTDSAKTTRYATGTALNLSLKSGTSINFTNGAETIATCTESTVKGKTSNETGEAVSTNIETLTWNGCNRTTDTLAKGKLEVKWTSGSNGEVIGKETQWTLGISGTSCSYGVGEGVKLGTLTGGETPTLKIEAAIPRTAGGVLCPSATTWDAEYVVTEPHALYIGS